MARKRTSKTRWGWIAFWTGLTICVATGAVVGAMLGKSDSRSDADEVQRVAALALDTSRLNDDALALSLAIEAAIARDELESHAEALRTELARLEWRAERIRVRAESQGSPGQSAEPVREEGGDVGGQAKRALREINATLAIFERDVVVQLESVLSLQPSSEPPVGEVAEPSTDEALADVVLVLEQQGQTLTNLTNELTRARQAAESPVSEDLGQGEEAANLISGSFQGAAGSRSETLTNAEAAPPEISAAEERVLQSLSRPWVEGHGMKAPASNGEIAEELTVSVHTVKSHLQVLFGKFGLGGLPQSRKRAALVETAFRAGVIGKR